MSRVFGEDILCAEFAIDSYKGVIYSAVEKLEELFEILVKDEQNQYGYILQNIAGTVHAINNLYLPYPDEEVLKIIIPKFKIEKLKEVFIEKFNKNKKLVTAKYRNAYFESCLKGFDLLYEMGNGYKKHVYEGFGHHKSMGERYNILYGAPEK